MSVPAAQVHVSGACESVHNAPFWLSLQPPDLPALHTRQARYAWVRGDLKPYGQLPHWLEISCNKYCNTIHSTRRKHGASTESQPRKISCTRLDSNTMYWLRFCSGTDTFQILAFAFCTSFASGKSLSQSRIRSMGIVNRPTIDSA